MTAAEKATETTIVCLKQLGQSIVTRENKNGDRPIRKAYRQQIATVVVTGAAAGTD